MSDCGHRNRGPVCEKCKKAAKRRIHRRTLEVLTEDEEE